MLIPIAVLGSIGYRPSQVQTPEVVLAIKVPFSRAPASLSLIACFIA